MSKWNVKVTVVGGLVVGVMATAGATAWADSFTPSIEEPVVGLGLLQGTPLGGLVPNGSSSSADQGQVQRYSTSGRDYRNGSADDLLSETPADKYGYWRTGAGAATGKGEGSHKGSGSGKGSGTGQGE